ncbi:FtsX-like permease family protein, partial [Clostridium polynesiense]|uniref:FtsX-like permease family protein n=1 Tax=Clostridium polynesiense TaxID=1325933 RepID=UPI000590FF65
IDVLGKTVSFDIKYSITDHKGNSKKTSKKAEFIIEGILENDDYLFDIPANYDTEVEKESPWNYNASMIYLPAEYIDSLYSSITIDDSSLFQLLHKDIAYGKVVLKASHPKNIPSIIRDLSLKGYDVTGNYWEAALYNGIKLTVALILGGIGFIIILVASVGVVNIMIMAVMERKREIQILKILGGNDKDINKLFLLEGGILGLLGGFIGIALSLLTINIINLIIEDFHIHINPYTIALILIISPVIALTAALPAVKIASREKAA